MTTFWPFLLSAGDQQARGGEESPCFPPCASVSMLLPPSLSLYQPLIQNLLREGGDFLLSGIQALGLQQILNTAAGESQGNFGVPRSQIIAVGTRGMQRTDPQSKRKLPFPQHGIRKCKTAKSRAGPCTEGELEPLTSEARTPCLLAKVTNANSRQALWRSPPILAPVPGPGEPRLLC